MERFIHEVVVSAAVVLIGAGLHGVVEVPAARLAELRRIIGGLDGHFLDRVQPAWLICLIARDAVGGVLAFDADGLRARGAR